MDEFHERSVQIDLSLAVCLKMLGGQHIEFPVVTGFGYFKF